MALTKEQIIETQEAAKVAYRSKQRIKEDKKAIQDAVAERMKEDLTPATPMPEPKKGK